MIETCLKCGHVNNASTGDDYEACPQCGAIYSKVARAMAPRQAKTKGPSFEGRYDALEQRITKRTGIGMGAWMLVLLVVVPVAWLYATQERSPGPDPVSQRAQALEAAVKAQQDVIQLAIMEKRVVVGMTSAQVQTVWGPPTNINRTVTEHNTSEQWVYRQSNMRTNYVHLVDGVVRSFQVSE